MVRTTLLKKLVDQELLVIGESVTEAVAAGNGTAILVEGRSDFSAIITATATSSGTPITFEASADGVAYAPIGFAAINGTRVATITYASDDSITLKLDGINAAKYIRAVVGTYVDGSYTVTILAN